MRTHWLSTSRTAAFVEQGVNQRGRKATEASTSAWADLWRNVWCEIDAWGGLGDTLSVRKVKAHTTPEAVLAGVITADDRAGNDLADAACKLVVFGTSGRRGFRPTWPSHAWLIGSRALVLRESVWWFQCSASCVVRTVVVWCEERCSATFLVRLQTLHVLTVFLVKFCVPSLVHVAPRAHFLRFCPAPFCHSSAT